MRKNKFIFLVVLFFGVGCSKQPHESLLTKWEKNIEEESFLERKLASSSPRQCFKNIFTVETLREEVRELEKRVKSSKKVNGRWRHLNLASLPLAQANFLKTYGERIGDLKDKESIDYSACSDVPCIFNKIYGREDYVAGYVHYLWYLKLGHLLSADNLVPEQSIIPGEYNGKEFPLSAYLYNEKELFALWRLTHMLSAPYTTLKYLTEVQRIPRGENLKGYSKGVCGLAYSSGYILLNDGCLIVHEGNQDEGYLYQAVIHEIGHQIDFQEGRGSGLSKRSSRPDYLDISGFFRKEYADENGNLHWEWGHIPEIKLISNYAGTSPAENFAESLAHYRLDGDKTKKFITTEHYQFISEGYYQNRSFNNEALFRMWLEDYAPEIDTLVLESILECNLGNKSSPIQNCLDKKGIEISNTIREKVSLYKPEGCRALSNYAYRDIWDSLIQDHIKVSFNKHLSALEGDMSYFLRIKDYYSELKDKTLARETYISCYAEDDEKLCYNAEVYERSYTKAETLKLSPDQAKKLAEMYLSFHTFDKIKEDTHKSYRTFISSHLEKIRDEAKKVWEGCSGINHNDDETPTGSYFHPGDGYLISSMYNCLNAVIPDSVKEVIHSLEVGGRFVNNPKEELILSREIQPHIITILKNTYQIQKDLELTRAKEKIEKDQGHIRKKLLEDFSWVKNILSTDKFSSDCKTAGYKEIAFNPLYHLNLELFSHFMDGICEGIIESNDFSFWLDNSQGLLSERVATELESKIIEAGFLQAQACIKKYPMGSATERIRYRTHREACLVDEWPNMEDKVILEVLSDPLMVKFKMNKEELLKKLKSNRRRLQIRVIKEKFN